MDPLPFARGGFGGQVGVRPEALGGALRYLRLQYTHDHTGNAVARTREISPELIAGYKWHPTTSGFCLQPWLGFAATLWRSADPVVDTVAHTPLPVQAFFTVNLGHQRAF